MKTSSKKRFKKSKHRQLRQLMSRANVPAVDLRLVWNENDGHYAFVKISRDNPLAGAMHALFPKGTVVDPSVLFFVLAEFEDGCDGFPCYGKANGVIPPGDKLVLYGEFQRHGPDRTAISGIYIRCDVSSKLHFMKVRGRDTCYETNYKFM